MDALAFVLALVPILWLVVVLLVFKWPAWKAAIGSFVLSCVLALGVWKLPADQVYRKPRGLPHGPVAHRSCYHRRGLYL